MTASGVQVVGADAHDSGPAGLINALTKMLVVSHEAKRSGVHKAWNGTPLALRA